MNSENIHIQLCVFETGPMQQYLQEMQKTDGLSACNTTLLNML